jgi:hypothetical protein
MNAVVAGLWALAAAGPVAAQQKLTLSQPLAEAAEPFTQISSIRELASGKVLVADTRDKVVQLLDLASGAVVKVGREGKGPGEYSFPGSLLPMPDGSTLLHDLLNSRFLSIGADGKPGDLVEFPRPPATQATEGSGRIMFAGGGLRNIRGADARGRIYFTGASLSPEGEGVDSVPLLRWDRVKPTFDTLGYLKQPRATVSRTGNAVMVRTGSNVRFSPIETWGVAGDGAIARVFPEPYRVGWISSGKIALGPVVPYTPLKVTEEDKKLVLDAMRRSPPTRIVMGGGGGDRPGAPPPAMSMPDPEFAATKPPFDGQGAVLVAPDGEVWVLRTRPASDKVPSYDVFDRTGTLVKKVSLNPSSRVVGFGRGTVYVVRTDEDDLQYLQRYPRPQASAQKP